MTAASDETKDLLLSRRDDIKWVDDATAFQCNRCDKVLIRHYISNCGHKFCLNCKKILGDGSKQWRCPLAECREIIENIDKQNFDFEEKLYDLSAHCPNDKYGCPFVSKLKDLGNHLKTCKNTKEMALPVIYDEANRLDNLLNQMSTFNERLETMQQAITEMKEQQSVRDKNRAETDGQIKQLISDLGTTGIQMKAASASWFEMLELKTEKGKLECKNETEKLVDQLRDEITALKKEFRETKYKYEIHVNKNLLSAEEVYNRIMKPEVQHFRRVEEYYKDPPTFSCILKDFQQLLSGSTKELLSEDFSLSGHPFGAQAKLIHITDIKLKLQIVYKDLNQPEKQVDIKLLPDVTYVLKVERKDAQHSNMFNSLCHPITTPAKGGVFYDINSIEIDNFFLNSPTYNVDDKVVIDMHVEPAEVAQLAYSHNGVLTWAIDDYQSRKQRENDDLIWGYKNPYFYTSPKGFRVRVRALLNGENFKGLTMKFYFLNGLYDAQLPRNFPHKTTVIIFNPMEPSRFIVKSADKDINTQPYYVINVGNHKQIANLLCNGTLYYQVTIEAR